MIKHCYKVASEPHDASKLRIIPAFSSTGSDQCQPRLAKGIAQRRPKPMNIQDVISGLQFVQDEASKVPGLLSQIAELTKALEAKTAHATKIEGDLLAEMVKTEGLTNDVRALEVARDEAGFRADTAEGKLKAIHEVVGVAAVQAQPAAQEPAPQEPVVAPVTPVVHEDYSPLAASSATPSPTVSSTPADVSASALPESTGTTPTSTEFSNASAIAEQAKEAAPPRDPYLDSYGHGPSLRFNGTERWNYVEHRWEAVPAKDPAPSSDYWTRAGY